MESATADLTLIGEVRYAPDVSWIDGRYEVVIKDEKEHVLDVGFAYTERGAIRKLNRKMDKVTEDFLGGVL